MTRHCRSRHAMHAAAMLAILAPGVAAAVDYTWSSGKLSQSAVPTVLGSTDTLAIVPGGTKTVDLDFSTRGPVSWADALSLDGGHLVDNSGSWTSTADTLLGGSGGTFHNQGSFGKGGGSGTTTVGAGVSFYNQGTVFADSGTLNFASGSATFDSGTRFIGAGHIRVSSNASFATGFSSQNLQLAGGTFLGHDTRISGLVEFLGGQLAGTWIVQGGQTLAIGAGSAKTIGTGGVTVQGRVSLADNVTLASGAFDNSAGGVIDLQGNLTIADGGNGSFTNSATLRKSAGSGSASVNVPYHGLRGSSVDAASGALVFNSASTAFDLGVQFAGAGEARIANGASFSGVVNSQSLVLAAGRFVGNPAYISGTVGWTGGTIVGNWSIYPDGTLRALPGSRKSFSGPIFNGGTIAVADAIYLDSGQLDNSGVLDLQGNAGIGGSGYATLVNHGVLRKSGGGTAALNDIRLENWSQIDVQSGTLVLNAADQRFDTGTRFSGSGEAVVTRAATFVDRFTTSGHLTLRDGSFRGGNGASGSKAIVGGDTAWSSGTLTGSWEVAAGSSFTLQPGAGKFLDGSLDNLGHVVLNDYLLLYPGRLLTNRGQLDLPGNVGMQTLGVGGVLINQGLLLKTAGSSMLAGVTLDNQTGGVIELQGGTLGLDFGSINEGTIRGNGTIQAVSLVSYGHMAPGSAASPTGRLTVRGGYAQIGGSLDIGLHSATEHGQLDVTDAAMLMGALQLICVGDCQIAAGTDLLILHSDGGLAGSFTALTMTGFGTGSFSLDYTSHEVLLHVLAATAPVPEPASGALALAGLAAVASVVRRRRG